LTIVRQAIITDRTSYIFTIVRGTFVRIQFITPVGSYTEFRQTDCLFDSICMNQINNCLLLAGSPIEHSLRDSLGCSWQNNFLLQRKCFETFGYNAIKIGLFLMQRYLIYNINKFSIKFFYFYLI